MGKFVRDIVVNENYRDKYLPDPAVENAVWGSGGRYFVVDSSSPSGLGTQIQWIQGSDGRIFWRYNPYRGDQYPIITEYMTLIGARPIGQGRGTPSLPIYEWVHVRSNI